MFAAINGKHHLQILRSNSICLNHPTLGCHAEMSMSIKDKLKLYYLNRSEWKIRNLKESIFPIIIF